MVPLEGLEPPTRDLGRRRSIQLSYRGRAVSGEDGARLFATALPSTVNHHIHRDYSTGGPAANRLLTLPISMEAAKKGANQSSPITTA